MALTVLTCIKEWKKGKTQLNLPKNVSTYCRHFDINTFLNKVKKTFFLETKTTLFFALSQSIVGLLVKKREKNDRETRDEIIYISSLTIQ